MPKTFVLNDETKINSHGFKVVTAGIELERFRANPVMLDYHDKSNKSVIGRWINIRVEGPKLLADAEFDEEDVDAKKIARKVETEFIKGCSMGLGITNAVWELRNDVPTLVACEITEASIVAIPSNAGAIRLYGAEGLELTADSIQLSINELINPLNPSVMKEIKLSAATLVVLGLESTSDATAVEQAVEKLAGKLQTAETNLQVVTADRDAKNTALELIQTEKVTSLVDLAIQEGRITADKRESFIALATNDFAMAKSVLDGIPKKIDLSVVNTGASDYSKIVDLTTLVNLSDEQKMEFKAQFPEKYNQIVNPSK